MDSLSYISDIDVEQVNNAHMLCKHQDAEKFIVTFLKTKCVTRPMRKTPSLEADKGILFRRSIPRSAKLISVVVSEILSMILLRFFAAGRVGSAIAE